MVFYLLLTFFIVNAHYQNQENDSNKPTENSSRPTVKPLNEGEIKKLVKDLDAARFAVRDNAFKLLKGQVGINCNFLDENLQKILKEDKTLSIEQKGKIETLLKDNSIDKESLKKVYHKLKDNYLLLYNTELFSKLKENQIPRVAEFYKLFNNNEKEINKILAEAGIQNETREVKKANKYLTQLLEENHFKLKGNTFVQDRRVVGFSDNDNVLEKDGNSYTLGFGCDNDDKEKKQVVLHVYSKPIPFKPQDYFSPMQLCKLGIDFTKPIEIELPKFEYTFNLKDGNKVPETKTITHRYTENDTHQVLASFVKFLYPYKDKLNFPYKDKEDLSQNEFYMDIWNKEESGGRVVQEVEIPVPSKQ